MTFVKYIPELVRRIERDPSFTKFDQDAACHADLLEKSLTQEQMKILRDYLDCIEGMALIRMAYAYDLGVEQGEPKASP